MGCCQAEHNTGARTEAPLSLDPRVGAILQVVLVAQDGLSGSGVYALLSLCHRKGLPQPLEQAQHVGQAGIRLPDARRHAAAHKADRDGAACGAPWTIPCEPILPLPSRA
jgi:hypothetical protein